jgi:hypothetical protein
MSLASCLDFRSGSIRFALCWADGSIMSEIRTGHAVVPIEMGYHGMRQPKLTGFCILLCASTSIQVGTRKKSEKRIAAPHKRKRFTEPYGRR